MRGERVFGLFIRHGSEFGRAMRGDRNRIGGQLNDSGAFLVRAIGPVASIRLERSYDDVNWTPVGTDSSPRFDPSAQCFVTIFIVNTFASTASSVWLRASALDASGTAAMLVTSLLIDRAPPPAPIELYALATPGGAMLSWRMPEGALINSFRVWRSETDGASWHLVADSYWPQDYSSPTYTDNGLAPGFTYTYAVSAIGSNGNESILSLPSHKARSCQYRCRPRSAECR
jgi:hypothetical protein